MVLACNGCKRIMGWDKTMFFFIGTEAELIKVFSVIMKCQEKGVICNIIASGQND